MTLPSQQSRRVPVNVAAHYTGVGTSTLNRLRSTGGGPRFLKICRRVTYDTNDLDEWLASKRQYRTSDYGPSGNTS
jgi:predicted DNA-binding transcriptional regulator AlpA